MYIKVGFKGVKIIEVCFRGGSQDYDLHYVLYEYTWSFILTKFSFSAIYVGWFETFDFNLEIFRNSLRKHAYLNKLKISPPKKNENFR